MTDQIDENTIKQIEKEINAMDKTMEEKINAEVEKRLKALETERLAKTEAEKKEQELQKKLSDMENAQKELQKQLEAVSLRKSIPNLPDQEPAKEKSWKDMDKMEKISLQKQYVEGIIGMSL